MRSITQNSTSLQLGAIVETYTRHIRFDSEESDGRTLRGLAVPFNDPTRIDNLFEGTFDEQFAPGSFKRSLGLRTPKLQFDHGTHPMIGSLPIGDIRKIWESKRGLEVEAEIFQADLFAPLREAIAAQAIDGMSIRFRPTVVESDETTQVELRTVTEAELIELGPVIFPAYPGTSVDLRSFDMDSKNDRRRLAEALLAGVRTVDHEIDTGPGTDPSAGSPATADDQDKAPLVGSLRTEIQQRRKFRERWI